jgi:hypothetical protein
MPPPPADDKILTKLAALVILGVLVWFVVTRFAPSAGNPPTQGGQGLARTAVAQLGAVSFPVVEETIEAATPEEKAQWVGAQVCGECHQKNYDGAIHTSHFKTSALVTSTLPGIFEGGGSLMRSGNPNLQYQMSREGGRHFQTALEFGKPVHKASADVVIGSGKLGQTYASWVKDALFQLPVTYFTPIKSWVNSPGYPQQSAHFERPLNSGCLDCHSTGFVPGSELETNNRYKSRQIVMGVTCERCHGKGREHVDFHRANPDVKTARHIIDPRKITVDERNALCSQCHGGVGGKMGPNQKPGVHSNNQLQRLKKSACFSQSDGVSCTDCHNPHRFERDNHKLFAQRCQKCHEVEDCKDLAPEKRDYFADNCSVCHMEPQPMQDIKMFTTQGIVLPEILDHYIRVIPSKSIRRVEK